MQRTYLQKLLFFPLIIAFFHFASVYIYACQCDIPDVCQAYTRADSVFTGKLIKTEKYDGLSTYAIKAFFEVEETFKGKTEKIETVIFAIGSCERDFVTGLKYFVYKEEPPDRNNFICNLTYLLSESTADYKYAKSLSETNPVYNVKGVIVGLSKDELKNLQIIIEQNDKIFTIQTDENSAYNFTTKNKSDIKVKIQLPFSAEIKTRLLGNEYQFSNGDEIEYTLKFKPNECDFRGIFIEKQNTQSKQNSINKLKEHLKTSNSLPQCSKIKLKSQS